VTAISIPTVRRQELHVSRGWQLVVLFSVAGILYAIFAGQHVLPMNDDNPVFRFLNDVRDWFDTNRGSGPLFVYVLDPIRQGITVLVTSIQSVLESMSWLGITAIGAGLGLVFVGWRTALLVAVAFFATGVLGLWESTIDTLALVLAAVTLSLVVGIPLGILAGRSDRFMHFVSPFLDVMQIMPTFAYLAPLALLFLIGPATAVIATMIYSIPPAIRITALGIRGVQSEAVEAAQSLGATRVQVLTKVQLPMARTTIGLAVNQTIMMAISMVVITALVAAPGLGEKIIRALETLNTGAAFEAGIAIVLLAMILDRLTASASASSDRAGPGATTVARVPRRTLAIVTLAAVGVAIVAGALLPIGKAFPTEWSLSFQDPVNTATTWIEQNLAAITGLVKDVTTNLLLNPLETVLTTSPWWLVAAVAAGIALIVSGRRAAIVCGAAVLAIAALQVWEPAMQTLAQVLVAVILTMLIGVALGVGGARNERLSRIMRPVNDAAQTMPSFVYLLPAVALFGATRFTAILAAIIYAVPAVVRLVEDGIRAVPQTVIEPATASGSTRLQMIAKVQLPMARRSLLVATNQGVVLVLAMVVVGGLVGAGALGYDVVAGFSQRSDFGSGMAAAIAIVMLGILLDRVTQGAGARQTRVKAG
jgi:glycine betaine/proline transport system permease protein